MREPLQAPQAPVWLTLLVCWVIVFTADIAARWVWN